MLQIFRTLLFLEKWPRGGHLLSGALGREQTGVEFEVPGVSGIGIYCEERRAQAGVPVLLEER